MKKAVRFGSLGFLFALFLTVGVPANADTATTGTNGALQASVHNKTANAVAGQTVNAVKKAPKYVASSQAASKLYHIPTCAAAKSIKAENLVGFSSKEAAAKAGYTPHDCVPVKKAS